MLAAFRALFALAILVAGTAAAAIPVAYAFEVEVGGGSSSGLLSTLGLSVGETISGSFVVETDATPSAGGTGNRVFRGAVTDIALTLGLASATGSTNSFLQVSDDASGRDAFNLQDSLSGSGPAIATNLIFGLVDTTQQVFDFPSDADIRIPETLSLTDFDSTTVSILFDRQLLDGSVVSLTVVPEPSTATMCGLGLLMMAAKRRRRVHAA